MERGMEGKKRTVHKCRKFLLISLLCLCLARISFGVRAADTGVYLTEAEGGVSVESVGGRGLLWSEGERLTSGNRVFTKEDGRARIGIGERRELLLEAGGVLEFRSRENGQEFLLENGILFFELSEECKGLGSHCGQIPYSDLHGERRSFLQCNGSSEWSGEKCFLDGRNRGRVCGLSEGRKWGAL